MAEWTDEQVSTAQRMWAEGYSAGQIAKHLGGLFSRCAVIGKIRRAGSPPRDLSKRVSTTRKVIELGKTNLSISAIAKTVGWSNKTVSATLSVARRLGEVIPKAVRRRSSGGVRRPARIKPITPVLRKAGRTAPRPKPEIPVPLMIGLMDLTDTTCRYPIGDGPFVFCGHEKQAGSSYCPGHHALCYVPPEERRKMRPVEMYSGFKRAA